MMSVASAGGRRVRVVPPVPVPTASRAIPVRVLVAVLVRLCRAGSVSVLLGAVALVWMLGTLFSSTHATTASSASTPGLASSTVAVRTVANVAGGPSGGGSSPAPKPAAAPSSSDSGSSSGGSSAPKPAASSSSPSSGAGGSGSSSADSNPTPKPSQPAPGAAPASPGSGASPAAKPAPQASPATDTTATPPATGTPKPAQPAATSTNPPAAGTPKPVTPASNAATTPQSGCGATTGPCGAAPKAPGQTGQTALTTTPPPTGAPKPPGQVDPTADTAAVAPRPGRPDQSGPSLSPALKRDGPQTPFGSADPMAALAAKYRAPGPANQGGSTSCGSGGCPAQPPAVPAPGGPVGPTNAGTGSPGGPGHAGGSGTARLNATGSTDPNTTQPVAADPRPNTLDQNQSLNTARGPPAPNADPTNPNTAPINPGPARPGSPNDQYSGFFGSIRHTWDSIVGTNVDSEPHNGGYVPATPGHPAQMDEGRADPVDLTEPERELLGVLPAGRGVKAVKWGVEGIQGLRTLENGPDSAPQAPTTRAPRDGSPATGSGPLDTSSPAADPGPGRVINRPGTMSGTRTPARRDTPSTAPAGRPSSSAGVRPGGPAGSRPGQRVGSPQTDREPALVGSGESPQPATGGRAPQALATPGTRTAPARPQAPRIEDPAPVRTLPNTRPAPETPPGGRPDLPSAAIRTQPGVGTTTDTGPTAPGQHPAGQPSGPETGPNPLARPGGQPDGPPTVGGGEKARSDVHHNGQLYRWDDQQQQWHSIARGDPGAALPPAGGSPAITSSGHPRIADLEGIFHGQPDELLRYQKLSRTPADQLSDADYKFVYGTRKQLTLAPNEPMTKVLGKDGVDKMINGPYSPDQVIGFVARGQDTDQLRTPQQLRDGLGLTPPLKPDGTPAWTSPIPTDGSYAYQLSWEAEDGTGLSVPYGAPAGASVPHIDNLIPGDPRRDGEPFTGTGTTSGGIPEWHANRAPITGPAQIWHIDKGGNRSLYAEYDPSTRTWKLTP